MMRKLLALSVITLLAACSPSSPESDAFFKKFTDAFTGDADKVLLTDVTDFPWEDVCLFRGDSAYPYVAYESYKDYVTAKELGGALGRKPYGLIFIFIDKGKIVREYFQGDDTLVVKEDTTHIELASGKPFIKFCSTPEGLTFTLDTEDSSALVISKQRPE